MKFKENVIFALVLMVTSCHTAKLTDEEAHKTSVSDRIARKIDWENRPLPSDSKHLTISEPVGSLHFTVPDGWHIQSQPAHNAPCYTLTHAGTFGNLPILSVELEAGERGRLSENLSHQKRLGDIQTNFPSAFRQDVGVVRLANGRSIRIVEYIDGDGAELASFIPENDHVSAFSLQAESKSALMQNRAAFESVLKSYKAKLP